MGVIGYQLWRWNQARNAEKHLDREQQEQQDLIQQAIQNAGEKPFGH
jgi:hypothetical protein